MFVILIVMMTSQLCYTYLETYQVVNLQRTLLYVNFASMKLFVFLLYLLN